ncbi:MAG: type II toxin-antitoxin system PemK/MazF family toxin [Deltaproteobacteria bacterium]|nr:type II toxin-antitoxin system PemK/MazF family toxin [Deltaproteobacteria bacterium]
MLELKRRIGFGAAKRPERFVVLQAEALSLALESIVVAPLDQALDVYRAFPAAIPISANEAGTASDQIVLLTQLGTLAASSFQVGPVGRLLPATLVEVDRMLKMVLGLR